MYATASVVHAVTEVDHPEQYLPQHLLAGPVQLGVNLLGTAGDRSSDPTSRPIAVDREQPASPMLEGLPQGVGEEGQRLSGRLGEQQIDQPGLQRETRGLSGLDDRLSKLFVVHRPDEDLTPRQDRREPGDACAVPIEVRPHSQHHQGGRRFPVGARTAGQQQRPDHRLLILGTTAMRGRGWLR
jgi:hypothetical protein